MSPGVVGPEATADRPLDLDAWLRTEVARVEAALERAVARWSPRMSDAVAQAVAHGVLSGGKRIRPVLCVAAWRAGRETDGEGVEPGDGVYDLAVSLELIHAYSLMHDDLPCMDAAELRRGRPTTWRVHGEDVTTRAGLALIPLAALQALEAAGSLGLDPERGRRIAGILLKAAGAGGMVGGQALDLLGEGRALEAHELDELHRHKTGALLAAAPRMGGLAAGAPPGTVEALEAYGRAVGLAFQIADDVLDATASAEELGKNPSDAELAKSTYVSLHGLDEARRRGRAQVDAALAALDGAGLHAPPLRALAGYIMDRKR